MSYKHEGVGNRGLSAQQLSQGAQDNHRQLWHRAGVRAGKGFSPIVSGLIRFIFKT